MKLKNLIKNKLIIKQKAYLRFSNLENEAKQVFIDNNNTLSLISKKTGISSKQILGHNHYSNLNISKYKTSKGSEIIKNVPQNVINFPYISKITNALKNNPKSLIILKPVKSGFITLLSNGLVAFMDYNNLINTYKTLYKKSADLDLANFLLKSTGQYKNTHDFFKIKIMSKIKTVNFRFKIKKGPRKKILSNKSTSLNLVIENSSNQIKKSKI